MRVLAHYAAAGAWVYLLIVGLATCASGVYLDRRLGALERPASYAGLDVVAAMTAPVLVPLLWLASAVVHGAGTGLAETCCRWFAGSGGVWFRALFVGGGGLLGAVQSWRVYRDWSRRHPAHPTANRLHARERIRRVLVDSGMNPDDVPPICVVSCEGRRCAVRGWFQPRIEVADSLLDELDDSALRAALLHELAHVERGDPLSAFFVSLSRVLNPFWGRLDRFASAWSFARELRCDRGALDRGADPVELADALVEAARARREGHSPCELCGDDDVTLKTRVNMLLADALPEAERSEGGVGGRLCFGLLVTGGFLVLGPHYLGVDPIDLHCL
ncbi:MAG: M56 family metallopeptidase, partial [Bradymonadaceae bacterium]